MIIEGIVTTMDEDEDIHIAAMGATVDVSFTRLVLRPFADTETFKNMERTNCGVFHVTDNANMIAHIAVNEHFDTGRYRRSSVVPGFLLPSCCRAYEFLGTDSATITDGRASFTADVVEAHHFKDFLGFNRAKHAILEAAILATRFHLLNLDDVAEEFRKFQIIVDKTGTIHDLDTMSMLQRKLNEARSK